MLYIGLITHFSSVVCDSEFSRVSPGLLLLQKVAVLAVVANHFVDKRDVRGLWEPALLVQYGEQTEWFL